MKKILVAAAMTAMVAGTPAFAAKDGELSKNNSVGKVDLTTVIPNMVRISGLDDMKIKVTADALNNTAFTGQDAYDNFCVYSNNGVDGAYNITVDGDAGTVLPYKMTGDGGELGFAVWVSDDPTNQFAGAGIGGNGYTWPGNVKTGYTTTRNHHARPATTDCTDVGEDASVHVRVNNSDILAAQSGTYKGTLKITVSAL